MERSLGRYSTYIYAVFRIVFGFMFMLHGMQKLFNVPPSKQPSELGGLILVAAIIEFGGGLLIMIGLFSSIAAFLSSGTMAVAYFMAHQPGGALPIMNGGELAVAYCFAFLYIASRGSGVWSVESMFKGSGSAAANGG
jgi:putative oxidoreductase